MTHYVLDIHNVRLKADTVMSHVYLPFIPGLWNLNRVEGLTCVCAINYIYHSAIDVVYHYHCNHGNGTLIVIVLYLLVYIMSDHECRFMVISFLNSWAQCKLPLAMESRIILVTDIYFAQSVNQTKNWGISYQLFQYLQKGLASC